MASPETVIVGLPQMDCAGLSESWLYKYCGDLHWRNMCRCFGVKPSELRNKEGSRILAVFLALRSRFNMPLSTIREDDSFEVETRLSRFGTAFYLSRTIFSSDSARLVVELLQTFAVRDADRGGNNLKPAAVHQRRTTDVEVMSSPPDLLKHFQAHRNNQAGDCEAFQGDYLTKVALAADAQYDPSPYVDFNGAGVLYFAVYSTIADILERSIATHAGIADPTRDWALTMSTIGRDIFYLGNLDLGDRIVGRINRAARSESRFVSGMNLFREGADIPFANIVTTKAVRSE